MIIDSSALLAILLEEPEAAAFIDTIVHAAPCRLPAPCFVEVALRLDRAPAARRVDVLEALIEQLGIEIVPFTAEHARRARGAFRVYGGGRHALNFGDCMVYAVAKLADAPLLYKGRDFTLTDIRAALPATT